MSDFLTTLAQMRRPRLLIQAARSGISDYRRDRDLKRFHPSPSSPEALICALIAAEQQLETHRTSGTASYSVARHIEVLIALLAEARHVLRPDQSDLAPNALRTP